MRNQKRNHRGARALTLAPLPTRRYTVQCGCAFHADCLVRHLAAAAAGEETKEAPGLDIALEVPEGAVCPSCSAPIVVDLAPPWQSWFSTKV